VLVAGSALPTAFSTTVAPILVSFVNIIDSERRTLLGVLDPDTLAFMPLDVPADVNPGPGGIAGMALSSRYIFMALRSLPGSSLLVLRRADLTIVNYYTCHLVKDIHALWASSWFLFAASTGTDEVVALHLFDHEIHEEIVVWRPDPDGPRADRHHINTVSVWRDNLLIAGFGAKAGESWSSAQQGFILNQTRNEVIVSGIEHPHSIVALDDTIAYCESGSKTVRIAGTSRCRQLPGFTRGLCLLGGKLFVGTSIGRYISRSTGRINNLAELGLDEGLCSVSRLDAGTLEIEQTVDLSDYGSEIYELLPVPGLCLSSGRLGGEVSEDL
jgi:hypothetical protein